MADQPRSCIVCNERMPDGASFCSTCGHDYRYPAVPAVPIVRRTPMPILAGGLIMLSGLAQFLAALEVLTEYGGEVPSLQSEEALILIVSLSLLMVGTLAATGGYYAMRRTRFAWALVGGVLTSGATMLVAGGTVTLMALGLVATVMLVASKDEFDA